MILPIDENYRLAGDIDCWRLEKRRIRKSADAWRRIRYYATLSEAVSSLKRLHLPTADAQTLADALAEVERISHELSRALEPPYVVERLEIADAR